MKRYIPFSLSLSILFISALGSILGHVDPIDNQTRLSVEHDRCAHLKEGVFYYKPAPDMHIIIILGTEIQTSNRIYPTHYKKYTIEWPENCTYKLTMIDDTDPGIGKTVGFINYVRITEITPTHYDLESKIGEEGDWKPGLRMYIPPDLEAALELQRSQ